MKRLRKTCFVRGYKTTTYLRNSFFKLQSNYCLLIYTEVQQSAITCLKLTIETLKQGVKYDQS